MTYELVYLIVFRSESNSLKFENESEIKEFS